MKVDLNREGITAFFKDWQVPLVEMYLKEDAEAGSAKAHQYLKDKGYKISRTSIIFFLQDMEEEGFLKSRGSTGKGGVRRIYSRTIVWDKFWDDAALKMLEIINEASGRRLFCLDEFESWIDDSRDLKGKAINDE